MGQETRAPPAASKRGHHKLTTRTSKHTIRRVPGIFTAKRPSARRQSRVWGCMPNLEVCRAVRIICISPSTLTHPRTGQSGVEGGKPGSNLSTYSLISPVRPHCTCQPRCGDVTSEVIDYLRVSDNSSPGTASIRRACGGLLVCAVQEEHRFRQPPPHSLERGNKAALSLEGGLASATHGSNICIATARLDASAYAKFTGLFL